MLQSQKAHAQDLLLDLVRYGLIEMTDGECWFRDELATYAYDDRNPNWAEVIEAIGWDNARDAVAKAQAGESEAA